MKIPQNLKNFCDSDVCIAYLNGHQMTWFYNQQQSNNMENYPQHLNGWEINVLVRMAKFHYVFLLKIRFKISRNEFYLFAENLQKEEISRHH